MRGIIGVPNVWNVGENSDLCACVKCVSQPSGRERGCWLPVRLRVTAKIGKWGRLQGISDSKRLELALRTSGKI